MWHHSSTCVAWLIHMCGMTQLRISHDSIVSVTWSIVFVSAGNSPSSLKYLSFYLSVSLSLSLSRLPALSLAQSRTFVFSLDLSLELLLSFFVLPSRARSLSHSVMINDICEKANVLCPWKCVCRNSFIVQMCDMTHAHVWRNSTVLTL